MPRALAYDRYGGLDVLAVRDLPLPTPGPGEVRVRVRAAALNPKDALVRKGRFRLLSGSAFPKRVGVDFAGEVVGTGERVWGALEELRYARGTLAEEVVARANELGPMPANLSFEEAAALPLASLTALQALRDLGGLAAGERVAIHGASGGVGTAAIQIARALGARVSTSSGAANRELCRSLGADEALDYATGELLAGRRYRVFFDAFGNLSLGRVRGALEPKGVYVSTVPSRRVLLDALRTWRGWPRARLVVVRSRRADLEALRAMVEAGQLRPVLDRVLPFERYAEALAHLETKRARGKIVLTLP